jgi:hypothetical protein
MKKTFKYKRTVLQASKIKIDRSYQRDLCQAHVDRIAREMDLDALRTFSVSDRGAGLYYCIDGQHRLLALEKQELLEWEVDVDLYSGLTVADEATLYRRLNAVRRMSRWDMFKAGVVGNDVDSLTIQDICLRNDLEPSHTAASGKIRCINALESVYRTWGACVLNDTLRYIVRIWGNTPTAVDGIIVKGMALVVGYAGAEIDWDGMHRVLAKVPGGPDGVIGTARGMKLAFPTQSIGWLCARVMVERYNQNKRINRIDWDKFGN